MKKNRNLLTLLMGLLLLVASCSDDDSDQDLPTDGMQDEQPDEMMAETTSFSITITNMVNYLNALVFNTPDGASDPGPLTEPGSSYSIEFKAAPGSRLSFALMTVISNDWFFAPTGEGVALFEDGQAVTGDITEKIYLWDSGTEEEDPATRTSEPGGAEAGEPDDDTTVRVVSTEVSDEIAVSLAYNEADGYFTLTIVNVQGAASATPVILSPGIVVLHAQNNPLFTENEDERGLGLADIAVQGNPAALHGWFTETGDSGAPLRLSSSFTVFAPGVVYAFDSDSDPVFTQGAPAIPESGVEASAEDGNNNIIFDYISGTLGLPAAQSNETAPVGPGESLTFTLEAPEGYKFGFNTMFVFSNDWFLAYNNSGYPLFNEDGSPKSGDGATERSYLYDAGTETDQPVGFGPDQAPNQSGPDTGDEDPDNLIRRVAEIADVQFGKGTISSDPGVVGFEDPRGGYNLVRITISPN